MMRWSPSCRCQSGRPNKFASLSAVALVTMNEQIIAATQLLPNFLAQHALLCAVALTLGVSLALPLAILAARRPRVRFWVLSITGLVQTVPGLALLAMFYPLLLGISDVTKALAGIDIPALGFL